MTYINDEQRRIIAHERLSQTLINDYFDTATNDLYKQMLELLIGFDELNPNLANIKKAQKLTVDAVQSALNPAFTAITSNMDEMSIKEASYIASTLTSYTLESFVTPNSDLIKRNIDTAIMTVSSSTFKKSGRWFEFIESYISDFEDDYKNIVTSAFAARRNNEQTAPTYRQTAKLLQERTKLKTKQALTLVNTGTAFYASEARKTFRDSNLDILAREVPFVTFDNRTSDICISISAKYGERGWPVGKSPIGDPPYHFRCRTTILYMTKGQESLQGKRTALSAVSGEAAREAYEKKKANLRKKSQVTYKGRKDLNVFDPSQIDVKTNISDWLRAQPAWFIFDTLGKTKGQKFIDGELDLKRLSDAKLKPLRVSEL